MRQHNTTPTDHPPNHSNAKDKTKWANGSITPTGYTHTHTACVCALLMSSKPALSCCSEVGVGAWTEGGAPWRSMEEEEWGVRWVLNWWCLSLATCFHVPPLSLLVDHHVICVLRVCRFLHLFYGKIYFGAWANCHSLVQVTWSSHSKLD